MSTYVIQYSPCIPNTGQIRRAVDDKISVLGHHNFNIFVVFS